MFSIKRRISNDERTFRGQTSQTKDLEVRQGSKGCHNTLELSQADQMTKTGMGNEIGLIAFLFQVFFVFLNLLFKLRCYEFKIGLT